MKKFQGSVVGRPRACIIRFQIDDKAAEREAHALTRAGFEVDVLLACAADGRSVRTADSVTYWQLPVQKKRGSAPRYGYEYGAWFALCSFWLARESNRQRFSYVQIDTLPDHQVFSALMARVQGATIGLFLKEPSEQLLATKTNSRLATNLARRVTIAAINFADIVFCVSEEHRASYVESGVDASKLHVILNANPPFPKAVRTRPIDDGLFIAVSHGTLEPRYGHETLIEAAALARHQLPGLRVRLPGQGSHQAVLEEMVRTRGLEDIVAFDGWLSDEDLGQLLADADLGIVAQESNPYAHLVQTTKMFDFIQAAVPVAATRLRSTEALLPTELQYFEPGDSESLADVICSMASNRARRETQAAAASARLLDIGWQAQMKTMINEVQVAVANRSDR